MKNTQRVQFQNQNGFTLIELLVVIIIITMASSALTSFLNPGNMNSLKKLVDLTSAQEVVLDKEQMDAFVGILKELSSSQGKETCLVGSALASDPFYGALVSQKEISIPQETR